MKKRIGKMVIDTDGLSVEDLAVVIKELHEIRARRLEADGLKRRMIELLTDAKKSGFTFIDQDSDQIWTGNNIELLDERA